MIDDMLNVKLTKPSIPNDTCRIEDLQEQGFYTTSSMAAKHSKAPFCEMKKTRSPDPDWNGEPISVNPGDDHEDDSIGYERFNGRNGSGSAEEYLLVEESPKYLP
ncbi:hypothetical protein PQX77_000371 [Marasmius sp. AFHP31]|nr:hypothetical protein PQX77_000371 [Marasmius sp. AFHP31]